MIINLCITARVKALEHYKMKYTRILFLLLALSLLTGAASHKFYVSVTNVKYAEDAKALQITTRIFIDDLEKVLNELYSIDAQLATEKEYRDADELISKYLLTKFTIRLDGQLQEIEFLGKEYKQDLVICYLEIVETDLKEVDTIEVKNDLLTEIFEEQQNVVHLKIGEEKKSFILVRENNKGMLNL